MAGRRRNVLFLRFIVGFFVALIFISIVSNIVFVVDHTQPPGSDELKRPKDHWTLKYTFQFRKARVDAFCHSDRGMSCPTELNWKEFSQFRTDPNRDLRWWEHIHIVERRNLLFCSIPKVASTNLLQYFLKMDEPLDSKIVREQAKHVHWRNFTSPQMKNLAEFPVERAKEIVETFTKVIWIRNPLERLISAWKNKLFTKYQPYYSNIVGSTIIRMFRPNASLTEIATGFPVELHEFFKFLLSQHRTQFFDVHWRPFVDLCFPCAIHYDSIGKLEEIDSEFPFIIQNITKLRNKIAPLQSPKERHSFDPKAAIKHSMELGLIDKSQLIKVLSLYKTDYEMFGYNIASDLDDDPPPSS